MSKLKWFAFGFFTCFALLAAGGGYFWWQISKEIDAYANLHVPTFESGFSEEIPAE